MCTSEILLSIAAFIVIVAGMKAAAVIVVPFVLSVFITIMCAPLMFWLQKKGVPAVPATLLTVLLVVSAGIVMAALVGQSVNDFSQDLPLYQEQIKAKTQAAALVQLAPGHAAAAAAGYIAFNLIMGNFIEPRFTGRGLGLSMLVVSLLFWGWVLGPVGMLLSVPLTITAKIALDSRPETRWLAIVVGPEQITASKPLAASPPKPNNPFRTVRASRRF